MNDIENHSYLYTKDNELMEKFTSILKEPVRSYVSVGSVIMAVLGLCFANKTPVVEGIRIALSAASLAATLPKVEFFDSGKLSKYIS